MGKTNDRQIVMRITIHRGTNEIGGSCVELSTETSRILIDLGMPLLDESSRELDSNSLKSFPIHELVKRRVLPDIPGLYDTDGSNPIDGILLSHAHQDHYGLFGYARQDTKFFMSKPTEVLINLTSTFGKPSNMLCDIRTFQTSEPFTIGDFRVTPYLMDHSAFDAHAFLIESGGKKVFYSGDFRGHGRKERAYQWFLHNAPQNIDALLMEGTTLGREQKSAITESMIEERLIELFKVPKTSNLVITSGQNVDRLVSIFRACRRTEKTMAIDFYVAWILKSLSEFAGLPYPGEDFPEIRVFFPYFLSKQFNSPKKQHYLYEFTEYKITKEQISEMSGKVVMMVRDSMLTDIKHIDKIDNGNLIYSMWTGYKDGSRMKSFVDYLIRERGFRLHDIHTSGHADFTALNQMVQALQPKNLIPIHTFEADLYSQLFNTPVMRLADRQEWVV